MTQILARTSSRLDGRHRMQMTPKLYMYTIVPIGVFYSLSLVCSNEVYLYLNVAFIQMLKGTAPVAVLIALSFLGLESPTIPKILNLCIIVFGVGLTSFGEIEFQLWGFLLQIAAVFFEAFRLAFTQKLLKDEKYKMDPLIGKTSSLILTLCGVLKSICLMVASVIIWSTVVMPMQFIGNFIAMGGLVYYNLGGKKVRETWEKVGWGEHCDCKSRGGKITTAVSLIMGCMGFLAFVAVWFGIALDLRGHLP
ncbi:MAG: hypothetical protein Q9212_004740 [Teloschistes hypoglaucus]